MNIKSNRVPVHVHVHVFIAIFNNKEGIEALKKNWYNNSTPHQLPVY